MDPNDPRVAARKEEIATAAATRACNASTADTRRETRSARRNAEGAWCDNTAPARERRTDAARGAGKRSRATEGVETRAGTSITARGANR